MARRDFDALEFFEQHPVFRTEDFIRAHTKGGRSPATSAALLHYHLKRKRLVLLRRGLYATETNSEPDPLLICSQLASDAVLAYGAALWHHGLLEGGEFFVYAYLTLGRSSPFQFDDHAFLPVRPSRAQRAAAKSTIIEAKLGSIDIRVTNLERTLVDLLDRLDLCEEEPLELARIFLWAPRYDVDAMIDYAARLKNRLCCGRLGVILAVTGRASDQQLTRLERLAPKSPCYFDQRYRAPGDGQVPGFNVIVGNTFEDAIAFERHLGRRVRRRR